MGGVWRDNCDNYDHKYSTNHVYLHRFSRLRFCVLNAFDFQTDFNLRFMRKRDVHFTCKCV